MLTHADVCTDTEAAEQHVFVGLSSDFVVKVAGAPVTGGEGGGGYIYPGKDPRARLRQPAPLYTSCRWILLSSAAVV